MHSHFHKQPNQNNWMASFLLALKMPIYFLFTVQMMYNLQNWKGYETWGKWDLRRKLVMTILSSSQYVGSYLVKSSIFSYAQVWWGADTMKFLFAAPASQTQMNKQKQMVHKLCIKFQRERYKTQLGKINKSLVVQVMDQSTPLLM